jgi:hypothetical protein
MADDVRDLMLQFLRDNELPESLMGFITEALAQNKSFAQIIIELRQTPEYLAAYPENTARIENGLSWMPEAEIRAYRDEARRLAREYMGVSDVSQEELTNIIGNGWSLRTWEVKLQRLQEFERWGPSVALVLEQELGYRPDDERLYAFFDDTPTPEFDEAYKRALTRAQPAVLGLGIRPEEEADILRLYGISPEQAFKGYQDLAAELPRAQRIGLIDAQIAKGTAQFPDGSQLFNDQTFSTLFKAIQLRDMESIAVLQAQLAREVARFQGQGGAARDQQGRSIGLLSEEERNL